MGLLVICFFAGLVLRLAQLQLMQGAELSEAAVRPALYRCTPYPYVQNYLDKKQAYIQLCTDMYERLRTFTDNALGYFRSYGHESKSI